MITMLAGVTFAVRETLFQGDHVALYRAVRDEDQRAVLLEVGSPAREYELTRGLSSHSVVRAIDRTIYDGLPTLILENFEGVPLRRFIGQPMPLVDALRMSVQIAEALAELHDEGVIHKDIKPDNILVDRVGEAVKFIGLGIATHWPREPQIVPGVQLIEGSLPYMSPEQTGRMNRTLDQRTDLYSLGVSFYEMFTGRLPFEAHDPLEWVYCHVAREPVALALRLPGLPRAVSDIVQKLLAKVADDRYATARGLAADLARCLDQWTRTGTVEPFSLGELDISEQLHVPDRLYGREAEVEQLLTAFRRLLTDGRPELVLVSGYSGVGKSSLIRELHRPLVHERGSFIVGKADQYNRSVPYSTIGTALRDLVLETLVKSQESISETRRDLQAALGPNARLVIDIIPEVELLIGEQPPTIPLPPTESKHSFLATCQRFVSVFARKDHPLTLFLDDLQWADAASLELLQHLIVHPDTEYLLALGAYRDSEISASHPLLSMLEEMRRTGAYVHEIHLRPLSPEHLTQLVADSVHASCDAASSLASLVHRKTLGNPFFAIQFMSTLRRDGLLEFDRSAHTWRWDVARIEARDYTDNVVELMIQKIASLSDETRTILKIAACVGTIADTRTLSLISNLSEDAVHRSLEAAVQEGLLLRTERAYRFLHDRIQQAAYSLIAEGERAEFHLALGRALLASRQQEDEHIFEIGNHYLLGKAALTDPSERTRATRLFLEVGKRARVALAYRDAVTFFSAGVAQLEPESWSTAYEVTYALHFELAECQWLTGDFVAAERSLPSLLLHSRTTTERFRAYGIQMRLHMIRGAPEKATCVGLEALRMIGHDWPLHPTREELTHVYDLACTVLRDRPIEALLDLPPMTDVEMRAAADLVSLMFDPAYLVDRSLYNLLSCFVVSVSTRYGNAPSSFVAYAVFANFIRADHARHSDCYRLAQVAYASLDRPEGKAFVAKICELVGPGAINSWVRPYRTGLGYVERGAREGVEHGDLLWGTYCASDISRTLFLAGEPLEDVYRESERCREYVRRSKYVEFAELHLSLERFIRRLRGARAPEAELDDAAFNAIINRQRHGFVAEIQFIWRLQQAYVFGDYPGALQAAVTARSHLSFVHGLTPAADFCLYHALTLAALQHETEPAACNERASTLAEHERQYRIWAEGCPENFAAPHALLVGEIARLAGREVEAERCYEDAIALARDAGLVHLEAIAAEIAARFHAGRRLDAITKMYLRQARAAYARWGADAKVQQLERLHPELVEGTETALWRIASRPEQMDLLSVIKASQTISGELDLDRLTGRLIQVVLEQSGAQLGRLLLLRDDELWIESEAMAGARGVETRPLSSIAAGSGLVPESVVQYVRRTRAKLMLSDARAPAGRDKFVSDEYLARVRPKSVLCLPIVRGTRVVGILYLENNLVTHAFTPEQECALDLLASQAAITVEVAFWIQQEREARAALERSESRFRRLSDAKLLGVVFAESNGRIIDANEYFLEMVGLTREDLAKGPIYWPALTPAEHAMADANAFREMDVCGVCRPYEKEFERKDGSRVPALVGAAFLEGSNDETVAYVLDISERKHAEEEHDRLLLREQGARAEAEAALHARDEFLSIAAHELRTPLTPLKMQIQMLASVARNTLPPGSPGYVQLSRMLEKSSSQVDRLIALIGDLVDVSTIGREPLRLALETTDLTKIVCVLVERFRPELDRAGCRLELRADEDVRGRWDRLRLEQVALNLLTNAIKYGPGRPIEIEVTKTVGRAKLTVRDHGIGIDEADRDRIFERFERAVPVRHFGGFGLGLYMSREIVRAHHGSIQVESRRGVGSTFTVLLPL